VLRRIFGPKRGDVTGEWRNLHAEKLHYLYSSPTIVRVIKSRRIRLAGYVLRMGRGEACTEIWWENLRERHHWGDLGVDGRIILRPIFRKCDVGGMDWIKLAQDRDRWRALVSMVMNLRLLYNAVNVLTSCKPVSFSRGTLLHGLSE
jgi:hypothetical protein